MRRREFIAGLGGAAAWSLAARAQPRERMRRIGVLTSLDENKRSGGMICAVRLVRVCSKDPQSCLGPEGARSY
jgi:hypothetical protein